MTEIERKWIITDLPELGDQKPLPYERHFIFTDEKVEVRIQRKGDKYEFERKFEASDLTRKGQKFEITAAEFESFKDHAIASLSRESYLLDGDISIKVYKGRHEGLVRAEIEFASEQEAEDFTPPDWFGEEITTAPLGRDKHLAFLADKDFKALLEKYRLASADIIKIASLTLNAAGELLIVKPKGKEVWISVGGKLEEGETEIGCLKREIREELQVGTRGEAEFYVATPLELAANTENTTVIIKFYLLDLDDAELVPDGDEIAEYRWISKADFEQIKAKNEIQIGSGLEYYALPKLIKDGLLK